MQEKKGDSSKLISDSKDIQQVQSDPQVKLEQDHVINISDDQQTAEQSQNKNRFRAYVYVVQAIQGMQDMINPEYELKNKQTQAQQSMRKRADDGTKKISQSDMSRENSQELSLAEKKKKFTKYKYLTRPLSDR